MPLFVKLDGKTKHNRWLFPPTPPGRTGVCGGKLTLNLDLFCRHFVDSCGSARVHCCRLYVTVDVNIALCVAFNKPELLPDTNMSSRRFHCAEPPDRSSDEMLFMRKKKN